MSRVICNVCTHHFTLVLIRKVHNEKRQKRQERYLSMLAKQHVCVTVPKHIFSITPIRIGKLDIYDLCA